MPDLWTAVSNMAVDHQGMPTQINKHVVFLFLVRAKHLPLSVHLTTDAHIANNLAPHIDHIRSLELVGFPDPYTLDPLAHPAPALEYLLLAPPQRTSISSRSMRPSLGTVLFNGHAPSLRALALFNPLVLPRQSFSKLTDVHINGLSKPHLADLLKLLRSAPALESLVIIDLHASFGSFFHHGPNHVPDTPLRRLRRLVLVGTTLIPGMALFCHLGVPREAAVHILELDASHQIGPFMTLLLQLPPLAAANMLEMVACGTALSFGTCVRTPDGSLVRGTRVRCTVERDEFTYGWWRGAWRALPSAQLTALRVALDAEDDTFLPRFLGAAAALATLELRLHSPAANVPTHPYGAPPALLGVCAILGQEMPVVCPCLAELALIDGSSSFRAWDGFLSGEETSARVAYVPDVLSLVAARAAAGRGLRRVAVQGRWRRAQRDRVRSAFAMGATVADFEFRELDADTPLLFEFEDEREKAWVNGYWKYKLPQSPLPWAPMSGSD